MGWSVRFPKSHTNWAGFFRPPTLQKSSLVLFAARPTGQRRGASPRPPRPRSPVHQLATAPRDATRPRPPVNWPAPGRVLVGAAQSKTLANWRAARAGAAVRPSLSRRPAQGRRPTGEAPCPWERPPRPGPRERKSPSKRPALPDPLMGGCKHKSSQGRADAQRLVATRLLDRLHDPLGHFSRLQRIHPRAR